FRCPRFVGSNSCDPRAHRAFRRRDQPMDFRHERRSVLPQTWRDRRSPVALLGGGSGMRMTASAALCGSLLLYATQSSALTRDEIIDTMREYVALEWAIVDTALALHDSPSHRYWKAGVLCEGQSHRRSPLVEWLLQEGDLYGQHSGGPYAFGARMTPSEAENWLSNGVRKAIGLCPSQWAQEGAFAGVTDCVAAGHAKEWPLWRSLGTQAMHDDAFSPDGYYKNLCVGACANTPRGYEEPQAGDLFVSPGEHVVVCVNVSAGGAGPTLVLECTGDAAAERCIERSQGSYEDFCQRGYAGVS